MRTSGDAKRGMPKNAGGAAHRIKAQDTAAAILNFKSVKEETKMRITTMIAGLMMLAGPAAPVHAQDYPSKPVRLIVPFEAAGTMDTLGRVVAAQVNKQSGMRIFLENKPGANSLIGTTAVATAAPDGYTLLNVSPSFVLVPLTSKNVQYDIFKDFVPITALGVGTGYILVVRQELPVNSVEELVALAKKSGKQLTYGTPGIGNALHLATEMFANKVNIKMLHIPYKGTNPALTAIAAGQVDVMVLSPATVVPFVQSGKVRPIAFTGTARSKEFPNVPTMQEAGLSDFAIKGTWVGWFAPARTPPAIVNKLAAEVSKALKDPHVEKTLVDGGFEPDGRPPVEFANFVHSEYLRYADVVKKSKVEPQ
jgi:tripartite-type tricarboxylate transporter receptor subunit TctC